MGVFANGLEISGKAVSAKTIAAMPDVCFTPPENPATPPGVPVPYPSFGMAGDTDKGTGTVKIGGETVNIKNKSHLTKTSGTEAGSAAKKGIVTSKNTGKEQFNSWSNDVKFDGEPVIRNTDMATNNHASPAGNTPPWVHIAKLAGRGKSCKTIYAELEGHQHKNKSEACDHSKTGKQSEHTVRASSLMHTRSSPSVSCPKFANYSEDEAPCICMKSNRTRATKTYKKNSTKNMPHYKKTSTVEDLLDSHRGGCWLTITTQGSSTSTSCSKACTRPTVGELADESAQATVDEHSKTKKMEQKEKDRVAKCLELINMTYIAGVKKKDSEAQAKKKVEKARKKPICMKGVCRADKSQACHKC